MASVALGLFITGCAPSVTTIQLRQVAAVPLGIGWHEWSDTIANQIDPKNIVVCGARWLSNTNTMASFVYVSHDGGTTWTLALDDHSTRWQSEQSCAFGNDNKVYFISGSSRLLEGDIRHELGQMHFYHSGDGGDTWSLSGVAGWIDHTTMTVDTSGIIYVFGNSVIENYGEHANSAPILWHSFDGGKTFASPARLSTNRAADYHGAFPSGARVMKSGRIIAVIYSFHSSAKGAKGKFRSTSGLIPQVDVVWSDDRGKTLTKAVMVARHWGCGGDQNQPAIAVDNADPQRVYVTFGSPDAGEWNAFERTTCYSTLAASNDGGLHWRKARIPGSGDSTGTVVAVNRNGILGVAWHQEHYDCWRFSYSADHGRRFSAPVDLSKCSRLVNTDRYLADVLIGVAEYEHPFTSKAVDPPPGHLGAGIMGGQSSDWRSNMIASSDGAFHIAWPEDNTGHLRTATISLPARSGEPVVRSGEVGTQAISNKIVPSPSALPRWHGRLKGLIDASSASGYSIERLWYDYRTKKVAVQLRLWNRGSIPLRAPIVLRFSNLDSDLGVPEGLNLSRGSAIDLTGFAAGGVLQPFSETGPITLVFHLQHYRMPHLCCPIVVTFSSQLWADGGGASP